MKKFILTLAVTMLAMHLPAPTMTLTLFPLSGGNLNIIGTGSGFPPTRGYNCVLLSTTDFINWHPLSTNKLSIYMTVTNTVQATNAKTFYRVAVY